MSFISKYLNDLWVAAMMLNKKIISAFLGYDENAEFLDLGCDDGEWSMLSWFCSEGSSWRWIFSAPTLLG